MTTQSQPSELDKAIEEAEKHWHKRGFTASKELAFIIAAAKRSKELEKENERLMLLAEKQMAVLTGAARPNVEIAEELSQLRADYKQALEELDRTYREALICCNGTSNLNASAIAIRCEQVLYAPSQ